MSFRKKITIANISAKPPGLWWRLILAVLVWIPLAAPAIGVLVGFTLLTRWSSDLPQVPDLAAWEKSAPQTTNIFVSDGTLAAEIPFTQGAESGHRRLVSFSEIPAVLVQALVAAEDVRFFEHNGVDLRGIARAAVTNYKAGRVVEGASTLTQQVARNLLPKSIGRQKKLRRKGREAILATRIEANFPKERILEVYANHTFFGAGSHGVKAAAERYFGKELSKLTVAEAAMIAGLAQAPSRANPVTNMPAATKRRNSVIERMLKAGFLTDAEANQASVEPVLLVNTSRRYGSLAPWHTEQARRQVQARWPREYARGGLTIETTAAAVASIETALAARETVDKLFSGDEEIPEIGSIAIDHVTRYVETSLGGWDWRKSKFDRSTQACRQPGSAFKPIVYAAAIENKKITAGTPLRDAPIAEWDSELGVHWKPTNGGRLFRGVALAQQALASSLNAPAVDVLDRVGTRAVVEMARNLGVTTPLAEVRPLALGSSCVYPLELTSAIATFPRGGEVMKPLFIKRVSHGENVLLDVSSPYDATLTGSRRLDRITAVASVEKEPAIKPTTAFILSSMLRDVARTGTARDSRKLRREVAGKTGTTNNNTDAWFVGYDSRVIASVWLGHDNPEKPLGKGKDGSHAALPVWMAMLRKVQDGRESESLLQNRPADIVQLRIDQETGFRAEPGAGGAADVFFERGTAPTQSVTHSVGLPVDLDRESHNF